MRALLFPFRGLIPMFRPVSSWARHAGTGCLIVSIAACGGLLDVSNPTLVRESDIANAGGANAKRLNVLYLLQDVAPQTAVDVAIFSDEWTYNLPVGYSSLDPVDLRDAAGMTALSQNDQHLGRWNRVFYSTSIAIPSVRAYTPDSLRGDFLGQLYAIRGYAVLQMAEDLCSGFAFSDVGPDNAPLAGAPMTNDSATVFASAQLDSALKYAHDSTRIVTLARVAKGRALLDQGKYAEAAAMVAPVATDATYEVIPQDNYLYEYMTGVNIIVGDDEGINGLPFVTENDARIPLAPYGVSAIDNTTPVYLTSKYPAPTSPLILASGIEARLIEAEAAVHAGDPSWITILNTLRATAIAPALAPLTAPVAADSQVNLVYRERAFWLYNTGRRLGDLRRLVRNYGRDAESVYPTGAYPPGGRYGDAIALPFLRADNAPVGTDLTAGCSEP